LFPNGASFRLAAFGLRSSMTKTLPRPCRHFLWREALLWLSLGTRSLGCTYRSKLGSADLCAVGPTWVRA
jgi:hypothetical protein